MSGNNAIARIDGRLLSDRDVFGLRLRDLESSFQSCRLADLRKNRPRYHALADFELGARRANLNHGAIDVGGNR